VRKLTVPEEEPIPEGACGLQRWAGDQTMESGQADGVTAEPGGKRQLDELEHR